MSASAPRGARTLVPPEEWHVELLPAGECHRLYSGGSWMDPDRLGPGGLCGLNRWHLPTGVSQCLALSEKLRRGICLLSGRMRLTEAGGTRPLPRGRLVKPTPHDPSSLEVEESGVLMEWWGMPQVTGTTISLREDDEYLLVESAVSEGDLVLCLSGEIYADGLGLASGEAVQASPPLSCLRARTNSTALIVSY